MWEDELAGLRAAPFDTGPGSVIVAYFASAEMGCFEALGWKRPANIIDLYAEFRVETNGLTLPMGRGLLGALAYYGLGGMSAGDKESMRELIMGGGPWTEEEKAAILDYCAEDVRALVPLLDAMAPRIAADRTRLGQAVLRGRYMASVAAMEHVGIPVDTEILRDLRERWTDIQDALIADVDSDYGVYEGRSFKAARFADWLARNGIPWPRLESGALALDDDTFRSMARALPGSLRAAGAPPRAEPNAARRHSVGRDGRNRTLLSPFRSKTGRNQPSNSRFLFGTAVWLRGLIKPATGMGIAYLDFGSQEIAIAAALSGDARTLGRLRLGRPLHGLRHRRGSRAARRHQADARGGEGPLQGHRARRPVRHVGAWHGQPRRSAGRGGPGAAPAAPRDLQGFLDMGGAEREPGPARPAADHALRLEDRARAGRGRERDGRC